MHIFFSIIITLGIPFVNAQPTASDMVKMEKNVLAYIQVQQEFYNECPKSQCNKRDEKIMKLSKQIELLHMENEKLGVYKTLEEGSSGFRKFLAAHGASIVKDIKTLELNDTLVTIPTRRSDQVFFDEDLWRIHGLIATVKSLKPLKFDVYELGGPKRNTESHEVLARLKNLAKLPSLDDWTTGVNVTKTAKKSGEYATFSIGVSYGVEGEDFVGKLQGIMDSGDYVYKLKFETNVLNDAVNKTIDDLADSNTGYYKYLFNCNNFDYEVIKRAISAEKINY